MKEMVHSTKVQTLRAPVATTASFTSAVMDVREAGSIAFIVQCGALTTANGTDKLFITIREGDLSDGSDHVAISDSSRMLQTLADPSAPSTFQIINSQGTYQNKAQMFGVTRGTKRYMTILGTVAASFSGIVGIVGLCQRVHSEPVTEGLA